MTSINGSHSNNCRVGEQPGNEEDLQGHPFVGPAGGVLDRALADASIDRTEAYVTNAVKHFKFEERGKRFAALEVLYRQLQSRLLAAHGRHGGMEIGNLVIDAFDGMFELVAVGPRLGQQPAHLGLGRRQIRLRCLQREARKVT